MMQDWYEHRIPFFAACDLSISKKKNIDKDLGYSKVSGELQTLINAYQDVKGFQLTPGKPVPVDMELSALPKGYNTLEEFSESDEEMEQDQDESLESGEEEMDQDEEDWESEPSEESEPEPEPVKIVKKKGGKKQTPILSNESFEF